MDSVKEEIYVFGIKRKSWTIIERFYLHENSHYISHKICCILIPRTTKSYFRIKCYMEILCSDNPLIRWFWSQAMVKEFHLHSTPIAYFICFTWIRKIAISHRNIHKGSHFQQHFHLNFNVHHRYCTKKSYGRLEK